MRQSCVSRRNVSESDATEASARLAVLSDFDRAVWACTFYGGLRIGEVRALQRGSIDLEAGVIRVAGSYDDFEGVQTTKTKAGAREVPVIFPLRRVLSAYLDATRGNDADALFPGQRGGKASTLPIFRLRTYEAWEKAPEAVGGPFARLSPHEGRHVFASWLIASGVGMFYVSRYMGHANTRITERVYAHLDRDRIARNVARVEAALAA